jgi:hypothetical protein
LRVVATVLQNAKTHYDGFAITPRKQTKVGTYPFRFKNLKRLKNMLTVIKPLLKTRNSAPRGGLRPITQAAASETACVTEPLRTTRKPTSHKALRALHKTQCNRYSTSRNNRANSPKASL